MIPSIRDFSVAINESGIKLSAKQIEKAAQFAHILHRENESQNLTRILGAKEFVEGHLHDVVELFHVELGLSVMDIGSGSGVPGLLAAALDEQVDREWFLVDSEVRKCEYLRAAATELDLTNVTVIHGRVDDIIGEIEPDTVVARAVGAVEKISAWIWKCSTWNNLVLFKSRGWEDEWKNARLTKFGKKLTVTQAHDYSTAERNRVLISLKRT